MKSLLKNAQVLLIGLLKYSGLLFVANKFFPLKNKQNLPNGTIWFVGIYVSVFTIALNLYSNRVSEIENRITTVMNFAIQKQYVSFFSTIKRVNNMMVPVKPELAWSHIFSPFTSLFSSNIQYKDGYADLKSILKEVNQKLEGVDLSDAELSDLDFSKGNFKNSKLLWVKMNSCVLFETDFSNAWLIHSKLKNSYLGGVILQNTMLNSSQLEKSYLWDVNLTYSDLSEANFDSCYIQYSDFSNSKLRNTSFNEAIILNSNFVGARYIDVHKLIKAKTLFGIKIEKIYWDEIKRLKPQLLDSIESNKFKLTAQEFWGFKLCPDIEYSNIRQ